MKSYTFISALKKITVGIVCTLSLFPYTSFAQGTPITLQTENLSPSPNGNFNWEIKVNSPTISGTTQITVKVYEQVSLPQVPPVVNQQNITISVDGGTYTSGAILLPSKTYVAEGVYTLNGAIQTTPSITITTGQPTSPTTIPGDTNPAVLNPTNPTIENQPGEGETYKLLAPLPVFGSIFNASGKSFGDYLSIMFTFFVSFAGVLAVVMLIFGGIQYMSTDAVTGKEEGLGKMQQAIWGLLIVLASYVILNTVNPNLVKFNFAIQGQTIEIEGDTNDPITNATSFIQTTQSLGIMCPQSGGLASIPQIASSFSGKTTYQMGGKGTQIQNNTVLLDCSGYVNRVLQCAGVSFVNGGTSSIFTGAESVTSLTNTTVNGITLKNGDLLGWKAGGGEKNGHVLIYVGGGKVMDSHGPAGKIGQAIGNFSVDKYKDRIKFIKRAP